MYCSGAQIPRTRQSVCPQKTNLFRTILLLTFSTSVTGCAGEPADEEAETLKIVEVFACSDYCPGPEEKYLKRVYEGVTDAEECRKLGGKPYTYIGWGQRTVCEVK